jgi:hypothetical protein
MTELVWITPERQALRHFSSFTRSLSQPALSNDPLQSHGARRGGTEAHQGDERGLNYND